MTVQILFNLALAVLLWMASVRLLREFEGLHRSPGAAVVAALIPPGLFFLMATALRSRWWLALGAALVALAVLAFGFAIMARLRPPPEPLEAEATVVTVGEALLRHLRAGRRVEAAALLNRAIARPPYDRLRAQLQWAASEWFALREGAGIAGEAGAPRVLVERVHADLEQAGEALGRMAESAAAASAQGVSTPAMEEAVDREAARLYRLSSAILAAREGLAQVTLAGTNHEEQLAQATSRLEALAEAARDLCRGV